MAVHISQYCLIQLKTLYTKILDEIIYLMI